MISCQELTELITDYLEGRLSWIDRLRFQMHIGMCRHCRRYLAQMRATRRSMHALPAEPPEAVQQELLHRFRHWHDTEGST